jgi:hypothetical protein
MFNYTVFYFLFARFYGVVAFLVALNSLRMGFLKYYS